MIGIQNIDQIYENYGEYKARSLLSGFLTSICFRVNDPKSKTFVRELHGVNRKKKSTRHRFKEEELLKMFVMQTWLRIGTLRD